MLTEEFVKIYDDEDLLSPNRVRNLSYINNSIELLSNSIDTVKYYLKKMAFVSSEYGDKLAGTLLNSEKKDEFRTKWREYGEGVSLVMSYDIEGIINLLDLFYFLRDNRSKYEIEYNNFNFLDETAEKKFMELLDIIINSTANMKQEAARIKTIRSFSDALDIVRQNGLLQSQIEYCGIDYPLLSQTIPGLITSTKSI